MCAFECLKCDTSSSDYLGRCVHKVCMCLSTETRKESRSIEDARAVMAPTYAHSIRRAVSAYLSELCVLGRAASAPLRLGKLPRQSCTTARARPNFKQVAGRAPWMEPRPQLQPAKPTHASTTARNVAKEGLVRSPPPNPQAYSSREKGTTCRLPPPAQAESREKGRENWVAFKRIAGANGSICREAKTNPRGIPYAPFVDRVEDYVSSRAEVEGTLKSFQEMISCVLPPLRLSVGTRNQALYVPGEKEKKVPTPELTKVYVVPENTSSWR